MHGSPRATKRHNTTRHTTIPRAHLHYPRQPQAGHRKLPSDEKKVKKKEGTKYLILYLLAELCQRVFPLNNIDSFSDGSCAEGPA